MTAKPPPATSVLQAMSLDVRLSRGGPEARWCGEVCTPGGSEKLCFLTLPSLLAWIAQLEPGTRAAEHH
jgi:hypothetical protein